jgi:hypothetical protein
MGKQNFHLEDWHCEIHPPTLETLYVANRHYKPYGDTVSEDSHWSATIRLRSLRSSYDLPGQCRPDCQLGTLTEGGYPCFVPTPPRLDTYYGKCTGRAAKAVSSLSL